MDANFEKKQRHPAYVTSKVDSGNQSTFAAISKNMILLQAFTKFGSHKKQKLYKIELMQLMSCAKLDLLDHRWHEYLVPRFFCCIPSFWMQISRRQQGFAAWTRARDFKRIWPKNRGVFPPKWMVKIMETLFFNGWFGGKTHYFRKHPYLPKGVWIPSRIPQTPLLQRFPKLVCSIWCIMQAKVWGLAWQGFCKFYIFVLHLLKHFLRENAEPLLSWPDEAVCRTLNSSRGWKKDGKLAEGTYMLQGMGDTPTLPLAMIVALHIVHGDAGKHN